MLMLSHFFVGVLLALLALGVWTVFRKYILKVFEELFVVFHVMRGGEGKYRVSELTGFKIYPFVAKTELLDEVALNDFHQLVSKYVGADKSIQYYHQTLLKYSHIVMFRDRVTGTLRGTLSFDFRRQKDHTLFVLGTAVMTQRYRGEMYFHLVPAYYVLKELVFHPFTPVYVIGKLQTYKSYLIACNTWKGYYPCYNEKTPEHLQKIMDEFAERIIGPDESYNRKTGVIEREAVNITLKKHVATITDKDRKNPHIRLFEERNPGWGKGNCLVVIAILNWMNVLRTVVKGISKGNKRNESHDPPPPLTKRYVSTQDKGYDVPAYEIDAFGGIRQRQNPFYTAQRSLINKETVSDLFGSVDMDDLKL